MKKVGSIFLSLFMLIAIMHVSVATHYCGGKEVATKISITGRLADCGMEAAKDKKPYQGSGFTKHCCDDVVTVYCISSNYTPAYSFVPELFNYYSHALAVPADLSAKSQIDLHRIYSYASPPGALISTNVNLDDICVFRI
jgi:hypothetical protein